jgi:hypothetical protein
MFVRTVALFILYGFFEIFKEIRSYCRGECNYCKDGLCDMGKVPSYDDVVPPNAIIPD